MSPRETMLIAERIKAAVEVAGWSMTQAVSEEQVALRNDAVAYLRDQLAVTKVEDEGRKSWTTEEMREALHSAVKSTEGDPPVRWIDEEENKT